MHKAAVQAGKLMNTVSYKKSIGLRVGGFSADNTAVLSAER